MKEEDIVARVQQNPKFHELVSKKAVWGWSLSIMMLAIYYGFIMVLAFNPQLLGARVGDGVTTWGMPVGLAIIVSAFVLTGIYVSKANGEFDALNQQVVEEVKK